MLRQVVVGLVLALITSSAVFGQLVETGEGWAPSEYTYTADEAASAKATWDAIREEVTQSKGDEWVGFYAGPYSDTGDVLFRWAPNAGFAVIWIGCLPGINDANYGGVVRTPDGLRLIPQLKFRRPWRNSMSERMVFVRWGQQRYVVPDEEMATFCDYTAGFTTHFYETEVPFLLHAGDKNKPVAETPDVPVAYRGLIKRPIDARVTSVSEPRRLPAQRDGDDEVVRLTVRLNKGSLDGVKVDFQFAHNADWFSGFVTVTAVEPHSCTAEFVAWVEPDKPNISAPEFKTFGSKLRVGMKLSTRRYVL